MKTLTKTLGAAALGLTLTTTSAQANPSNVEFVTEGLIAVGMALELSDVCDDVSARRVRGVNFLFSLKRHLEGLGYSDAEIDAFVDNDVEKDRLEGIARQRLVALGAQPGDAASHCTVARAQMSAGTQVGQLLR